MEAYLLVWCGITHFGGACCNVDTHSQKQQSQRASPHIVITHHLSDTSCNYLTLWIIHEFVYTLASDRPAHQRFLWCYAQPRAYVQSHDLVRERTCGRDRSCYSRQYIQHNTNWGVNALSWRSQRPLSWGFSPKGVSCFSVGRRLWNNAANLHSPGW